MIITATILLLLAIFGLGIYLTSVIFSIQDEVSDCTNNTVLWNYDLLIVITTILLTIPSISTIFLLNSTLNNSIPAISFIVMMILSGAGLIWTSIGFNSTDIDCEIKEKNGILITGITLVVICVLLLVVYGLRN